MESIGWRVEQQLQYIGIILPEDPQSNQPEVTAGTEALRV